MDKWDIKWADWGKANIEKYLEEGYEPFAVTGGIDEYPDRVYFRKKTDKAKENNDSKV